MRYNEKIDMFLGMAQLLRDNIDVKRLTLNIENDFEGFQNDIKTKIKGHHDDNIGSMCSLVKTWAAK